MYRGFKKVFTLCSLLLGIWVFVRIFLPLCLPFLLGAALALASEPSVRFLTRQGHMPRGLSAPLGVTGTLVLLVLLITVVLALVLRQLGALVSILPNLEEAAASGIRILSAWALDLLARLPGNLGNVLESGVLEFFSGSSQLLTQALGYVVSLTGGILSRVPNSALILGTAVISGYMLSIRLPRIRQWLRKRIPQERIQTFLQGLSRLRSALGGWLLAQLKLVGIAWGLLTLGFVILRIPNALLWAGAVSLVDAFPILGVGTVLLPWSLICLVQGDTPRAIGLLGIYGVISLSRSALEPKLVGRQLGLDPLATLAALYAGYRLWGFGGLIFAPVLAVAAVQLIRDPES